MGFSNINSMGDSMGVLISIIWGFLSGSTAEAHPMEKMISSNINYMGCSIVMGVAQNVWLPENPITMDDDWC